MTKINKVLVPKSGTYKCVVLSDGVNYVFRADNGGFHFEVTKAVKTKEPLLENYHVCGGGRVSINSTSIRVYGYSVDFGNMDKGVVETLLSEYAKDNNVSFINDTGKGY